MKCKECFKREAVIKSALVSIRYAKETAIEIVCDNVCMECFTKSLNRKSTFDCPNPIESVKINTDLINLSKL